MSAADGRAPSRVCVHAVAYRETVLRGVATPKARRRSGSSCASCSVIAMSRIGLFGRITAGLLQANRGVVRVHPGLWWRSDGLPVPDLEKHHPRVYFGLRCPLVSTARSDGATNYTHCTVKLSQLGCPFLCQWLASMLLTHVRHETTICMPGICGPVPH